MSNLEIVNGRFMRNGEFVRPEIGDREQADLNLDYRLALDAGRYRPTVYQHDKDSVFTVWFEAKCPRCRALIEFGSWEDEKKEAKANLDGAATTCEGCGHEWKAVAGGYGGWFTILPKQVTHQFPRRVERCSAPRGDLFTSNEGTASK